MTEDDQTAVWVKNQLLSSVSFSAFVCDMLCFTVKADCFFPPKDACALLILIFMLLNDTQRSKYLETLERLTVSLKARIVLIRIVRVKSELAGKFSSG